MSPTLLLYNFTKEEQKEWLMAVKPAAPDTLAVFVKPDFFNHPISLLLEKHPSMKSEVDLTADLFHGRMIVFCNIPTNLLRYFLSVRRMITKEHIYCAVMTETNSKWTSTYLYHHLEEEEAEILAKASNK